MTVTNDQGGTDDAVATVLVNGAPVINISMPTSVRAGDSALFDASESYDPEGGQMAFSWDFDIKVDTNGDGDPLNDLDALTPEVLFDTTTSGMIHGILRIDDSDGAFATESFELNITTRTFNVVWVTETIDISWDEYLEQGSDMGRESDTRRKRAQSSPLTLCWNSIETLHLHTITSHWSSISLMIIIEKLLKPKPEITPPMNPQRLKCRLMK